MLLKTWLGRVMVTLLATSLGLGVMGAAMVVTEKPAVAWSNYDFPPHWPNVDSPNIYSGAAYVCATSHYLAANRVYDTYDYGRVSFENLRSCIDFILMQKDTVPLGRVAYVIDFYKWGGVTVQRVAHVINGFYDGWLLVISAYAKFNKALATVAGCAWMVESSGLTGWTKVASSVGCDSASAYYDLQHDISQG